ncbi:MAG: hypothetical protein LBK67_09315 [Coriobacteriales bacterium]|jgi:hypothetical protein|nr:hypothetical protein [Coriobacteriales bacterium]
MNDLGIDFTASAFKHGVSEDSIICVLAWPTIPHDDPKRPEVIWVIGTDSHGTLIEVAYDKVRRTVFHAMPTK